MPQPDHLVLPATAAPAPQREPACRSQAPAAALQLRPVVNTLSARTVAFEVLMEAAEATADERLALASGQTPVALEVARRVKVVHRLLESRLLGAAQLLFLPIKPSLAGATEHGLGPLLDQLEDCALPAERLVLQIEEAPGHGDLERVRLLTRTFRQRGYQVAITGFGGGFSGLQELLECPPDFVRLSPGLTGRLLEDRAQRSVVKALAGMAQDLQLTLVADAVGSPEALLWLRSTGIVLQQGPQFGVHHQIDTRMAGNA